MTPQMMSPPEKSAVEESAEAKTIERALKLEDFGRNMKLIETNDGQNVHGQQNLQWNKYKSASN